MTFHDAAVTALEGVVFLVLCVCLVALLGMAG